MFRLLANGPFGMVFKHLQDSFDPKDLTNGLIHLHQLCSHVAMRHIFGSMIRVLGTSRFLVLAKPSSGIHPIVVEEVFYRLMSRVLCLQFCDAFAFHLSPYQFGVVVKRGCEAMVYGIWAILDAHHNWVVFQVNIMNAFNTISCKTIFQEL
jgi:hypothetical protein